MNYHNLIREALREDVGNTDITTRSIIPPSKKIEVILVAKEDCIVCGLGIARAVFMAIDKKIIFLSMRKEGERARRGDVIAKLSGKAQAILTLRGLP